MAAAAAVACSSSSSFLCVHPSHSPISHLRLSHSKSLRFKSGQVQLKAVSTEVVTKESTNTTTPPPSSSSSAPAITTFDLNLGDRSYPIYIGSGLLDQPDLLQRDPDALAYVIKRSCENKAEIVSLHETEDGLRATLNLGHTFGHALETGCGYGERLHGEAVAAGTAMAVDMSYRFGWIDNSVVERANKILKQAKLPTGPPENVTVEMFKSVMALDKKVADGLLRLVHLKGPLAGCVFTGDYDRKALDETLYAFCKS